MTRYLLALIALLEAGALAVAAEVQTAIPTPRAPSAEEQMHLGAVQAVREKGQASAAEMQLLIEKLKNPSPLVRAHAAQVLGQLGEAGRPAVEALVPLAADPDPLVRREAAHAVLKIRPGPAVTIPLVKKLLADADPGLRNRILNTLAGLGKAAVPGLIEALKDDEAGKYACLVLASIGPDAVDAVPALVARLKTEKRPEVQQQIVTALGAIGSAAAVPALAEELSAAEDATCVAAAFALGRIGPPARAGEAVLNKSLASSDAVLKVVSAWALAKIAPEDAAAKDRAVEVLAEALLECGSAGAARPFAVSLTCAPVRHGSCRSSSGSWRARTRRRSPKRSMSWPRWARRPCRP